MPFACKNVLLIGATSGIGVALAAKLVDNGNVSDRFDRFRAA